MDLASIPKICAICKVDPVDDISCPQPCAGYIQLEVLRDVIAELFGKINLSGEDP